MNSSAHRVVAAAALALLVACGTLPPRAAIRPAPLPDEPRARQLAIGQIGRQLFVALADGAPERLMVDRSELRSILDVDGAMRVVELREQQGSAPGLAAAELRAAYNGAKYKGVCFDRARLEPAGSPVGLLSEAFVFERALVVSEDTSSSVIAGWMEGLFMGTGDLAVALVLQRVESPRRDHPDLSLLQCDLADGLTYH